MTSETKELDPSIRLIRINAEKYKNYGKTREILSEESFVRVVLTERLSSREARDRYGILQKTMDLSRAVYREKYGKEMEVVRRYHCSYALRGNRHGQKDKPAVLVPKEVLEECINKKMTLYHTAQQLGISEWYVRESIKYHNLRFLDKSLALPPRLAEVDFSLLEKLEIYSPGITQKAVDYYRDPHKYFLALYESFLRVNEMVWFIKEHSKLHDYYVCKKKVPKDHICWNINRNELVLSMALMAHNIPHIRQFQLVKGKNYLIDFAFPGTNVLVEVDGAFHRRNVTTQRLDRKKTKIAVELGYTLLRFTDEEVMKDIHRVLDSIQKALSKELPPAES